MSHDSDPQTASCANRYRSPPVVVAGASEGDNLVGDKDVLEQIELSLRRAESALESFNTVAPTTCPLSVIVPVFNERATLPEVLSRIETAFPSDTQTVIVDDASTDGTAEWLNALEPSPHRVVLHRRRNHGKGSAVRLGVRHSRGDVVVIQDADLEYDPADLVPLVNRIAAGTADVVYGSRYLSDGDDNSFWHRLGNSLLTKLSNCMSDTQLTDMETCHKAFRGDLIRSIAIRECRFGFEPEITSKLARRGITILEMPTRYQYRSYEEGKKITWKDGVAAFGCLWRYRNPGWAGRVASSIGNQFTRPLRSNKPSD